MKLTQLRPLGFIACAFILTPVCPAALTLTEKATENPFTVMHVFGDSLSDTGNASIATGGTNPGPDYFAGRYSNGPVWVERFAIDHLGLAAPLPSLAGGTNHAFAGASSSGALDQINGFIGGGGTFLATDLVVLWAGANDFLGGATDPSVPVANLVTGIQLLIGAGAMNILVPNLPDLSDTPQISSMNNPAASGGAQALSVGFNTILDGQLVSLQSSLDQSLVGTDLFALDIFALGKEIIADPAAFGVVNISDSAYPDNVADANGYIYWDEIHPTEAMHAIIAVRALNAPRVPEPSAVVFLAVGVFGIMLPRRRAR